MENTVTLVLGSVLFFGGMRGRRVLVRWSVTAKDLFKGRNSNSPRPVCDGPELLLIPV